VQMFGKASTLFQMVGSRKRD